MVSLSSDFTLQWHSITLQWLCTFFKLCKYFVDKYVYFCFGLPCSFCIWKNNHLSWWRTVQDNIIVGRGLITFYLMKTPIWWRPYILLTYPSFSTCPFPPPLLFCCLVSLAGCLIVPRLMYYFVLLIWGPALVKPW